MLLSHLNGWKVISLRFRVCEVKHKKHFSSSVFLAAIFSFFFEDFIFHHLFLLSRVFNWQWTLWCPLNCQINDNILFPVDFQFNCKRLFDVTWMCASSHSKNLFDLFSYIFILLYFVGVFFMYRGLHQVYTWLASRDTRRVPLKNREQREKKCKWQANYMNVCLCERKKRDKEKSVLIKHSMRSDCKWQVMEGYARDRINWINWWEWSDSEPLQSNVRWCSRDGWIGQSTWNLSSSFFFSPLFFLSPHSVFHCVHTCLFCISCSRIFHRRGTDKRESESESNLHLNVYPSMHSPCFYLLRSLSHSLTRWSFFSLAHTHFLLFHTSKLICSSATPMHHSIQRADLLKE